MKFEFLLQFKIRMLLLIKKHSLMNLLTLSASLWSLQMGETYTIKFFITKNNKFTLQKERYLIA